MRFNNSSIENKFTCHANIVIAIFLYIRSLFCIPIAQEISDSSLIIRTFKIKGCYLQNSRQEVDFYKINQHNISCIKDKLDSKDRIEFVDDVYVRFKEHAMKYFERSNNPRPSLTQSYIFCSLYLARKGCILVLIFCVAVNTSLNVSSLKD
jgi:hypothetical protein